MLSLSKEQLARINKLTNANGGTIEPRQIVADARDKKSPLHTLFEWDKDKAHTIYLEDRAREVIYAVRVEVTVSERMMVVPRFVKNPSVPGNEQGYIELERLLTDEDASRNALVNEFEQAAAKLRRARNIAAFLNCAEQVDAAIANIASARAILDSRPQVGGQPS